MTAWISCEAALPVSRRREAWDSENNESIRSRVSGGTFRGVMIAALYERAFLDVTPLRG